MRKKRITDQLNKNEKKSNRSIKQEWEKKRVTDQLNKNEKKEDNKSIKQEWEKRG